MDLYAILSDLPWWVWLIHALLLPLYQIIGTIKHEGAHAVAAMIQGFRILEFKFLPSRDPERGFLWGYVKWYSEDKEVSTHVYLAPYYVDAAMFISGIVTIEALGIDWSVRPNTLLITLILLFGLPIVDLVYNVGKWFLFDKGDFADAFGKVSE